MGADTLGNVVNDISWTFKVELVTEEKKKLMKSKLEGELKKIKKKENEIEKNRNAKRMNKNEKVQRAAEIFTTHSSQKYLLYNAKTLAK